MIPAGAPPRSLLQGALEAVPRIIQLPPPQEQARE